MIKKIKLILYEWFQPFVLLRMIFSAIIFFISDAKRLIGQRFEDATVQSDMKQWPFDVIKDGRKPKVQVEFKGEKKTLAP